MVGQSYGALAQLGERLICIQEVRSSILLGSTRIWPRINHLGLAPFGRFASQITYRGDEFLLTQKSLGR